jgi:hypothetical protein
MVAAHASVQVGTIAAAMFRNILCVCHSYCKKAACGLFERDEPCRVKGRNLISQPYAEKRR